MQAIGFAHESAQMIALDGTFEERFGCPNKDLGIISQTWLPGDTERPGRKALTVFVQLRDTFLSAESAMFRKSIQHSAVKSQLFFSR
jgi:hypothetical protein